MAIDAHSAASENFLISTYGKKKLSFPHLPFFALRLFDIALFYKHHFIFTLRMALLQAC